MVSIDISLNEGQPRMDLAFQFPFNYLTTPLPIHNTDF